jgi:hypothetical protein
MSSDVSGRLSRLAAGLQEIGLAHGPIFLSHPQEKGGETGSLRVMFSSVDGNLVEAFRKDHQNLMLPRYACPIDDPAQTLISELEKTKR